MATIRTTNSPNMTTINVWRGLHEAPDGDTNLQDGEAAVMRNFKITSAAHLQVRPGTKTVYEVEDNLVGLWRGKIQSEEYLLYATATEVFWVDTEVWTAHSIGEIAETTQVHFFGFANQVYLLTGQEYYAWDGENELTVVEGYIPIVATATPPAGGGTLLEEINLLTDKRRQEFSPDGSSTVFQLAETDITEVVTVTKNGGTVSNYTTDLTAGTVTFSTPPDEGTSTVTITWRKEDEKEENRAIVTQMTLSELYNGESDNRVFLYGDGSNLAIYSGLDEDGQPTAEYFPALNEVQVDSANSKITAMIRHYNRLICFKETSAFALTYSTLTTSDGRVLPAFYVASINQEIGCGAMGQARLVENNPRTAFSSGVYNWPILSYSAYDERSARRISQRVDETLSTLDLSLAVTYDDERRQEYYLSQGGTTVVHGYEVDAWYIYTDFYADGFFTLNDELYLYTGGAIKHVSRTYRNDDGADIDCYWESGSMDFGRGYQRKYSSDMWVSIKPESNAYLLVTAESNVKSSYTQKTVAAGLSTFFHIDFNHFSFGTNRKPQVVRVRLKVKKFVFYKLIFAVKSSAATATVLSVDIRTSYSSDVK